MKICDAVDRALWAIEEPWLLTIRGIALGDGEGPEAVAARLGRPLQNAQTATVRDGVAIIPLVGPIFRYANLFTQVSGATSIDLFARDLRAALDDSAVRGILLEINSPGGQVDGINEAADMVVAAEKPVAAYVSGMGASAAYWLAAAADHVVMDATARVGSIGVVVAVNHDRKEKDGVLEIVSSQSPHKRLDVMTPEGRASIQTQVDAIADVFIEAVARNRGVSRETVTDGFGGGSVKVGAAAIAAGMADSAGSLESTLSQLSAGEIPKRRRQKMATENVAAKGPDEAAMKIASDNAYSTGHAAGQKLGLDDGWKAGLDEGTKLERVRMLAIDGATMPGHEKLAAEAKASGMNAADFALKQVATEKLTRETRLSALKEDGKQAAEIAPTATGEQKPAGEDVNRPMAERAKAVWDADAKLRDEFSENFESYLAYRKNDAASRVRILHEKRAV